MGISFLKIKTFWVPVLVLLQSFISFGQDTFEKVSLNPVTDTVHLTPDDAGVSKDAQQLLSVCVTAVNPSSMNFGYQGSTSYAGVVRNGTCTYSVSTSTGWITATKINGDNAVQVTTAANTGGARTGYVWVGEKTITVTQDAYCPVPPQPGPITGNATVCSGSHYTYTYSISAVSGASGYNWTVSGGSIVSGQGTTSISVYFNAGTSATVSVASRNSCGNTSAYTTKSISINTTPSQPGTISGTASVCEASTYLYSISPVSGATSYTWTIPSGASGSSTTNNINVTFGESSGNITVKANNAGCSSTASSLSVSVSKAYKYTVTGGGTICPGQSVPIGLNGSTSGLQYKLYLNGSFLTPPITGTGSSISFGNKSQGGTYTVKAVTAAGCEVPMNGSAVINTQTNSTGASSVSATKTEVCAGDNTVLTQIGGTLGAGAVWKWHTDNHGSNLAGTGSSITVTPPSTTTYYVRAEGTCNTTGFASVNIIRTEPLNISQNPADVVACQNTSVTYNSFANERPAYQWQRSTNGGSSYESISGANSSSYTFINSIADSGNLYRCLLTNVCGTAYSNPARLTVKKNTSIITQPANQQVLEGDVAVYSVKAVGSGLTYNWKKSSDNINFTDADGNHTSSSYNLKAVSAVNGMYFKCAVSGECGTPTVNSAAVSITVLPNPSNTFTTYVPPEKSDENYIETVTPRIAISAEDLDKVFSFTSNKTYPAGAILNQIDYYDGLGRKMQTVNYRAAGNTQLDVIQPFEYDEFGREVIKYLPYTSGSSGEHHENYPDEQFSFYNYTNDKVADDAYPYSVTVFENSPLNRILARGAPGLAWQPDQGHAVEFEYRTNTVNDSVYGWNVNYDSNYTFAGRYERFLYEPGQLFIVQTMDENGNITEEFKDKEQRVILKRAYPGGTRLNTYYIYDDFGMLVCVVPPKANGTIQGNENLCYFYKYDERLRMAEKKLPGAQPVYMVYDPRDRLVLTQDGERRKLRQWLFTKYDCLNRPVLTGIYTHPAGLNQSQMQNLLNSLYNGSNPRSYFVERNTSLTASLGFTDESFPKSSDGSMEYLTATYYDSYDFPDKMNPDQTISFSGYSDSEGDARYFDRVTGKVTGTKVRVLNTSFYSTLTNYYDDYGRVIQSVKKGIYPDNNAKEVVSNQYGFTGEILETKQYQFFNNTADTITKFYTYDHAGRLIRTGQQISGDANGKVTLSELACNQIGQLVEKNLHAGLQNIDYRYNIRGWLTSINNADLTNDGNKNDDTNDLFGMELAYNNPLLGAESMFNGNISAMVWKNSGDRKKGYAFSYDDLNRLTSSDYKVYCPNLTDSLSFEEKGLQYDENGNIQKLTRTNSTGANLHNFLYKYIGNQLDSLINRDNSSQRFKYNYDNNGNMVYDGLKGFTVKYNLLNLPEIVKGGTDSIKYVYDAAGTKLAKLKNNTPVTYYAGNFVYNGSKQLDYIITEEGMVKKTGSQYSYEYYLKDHLGNIRTVFRPGTGGTIITEQVNAYYPFGMLFAKNNTDKNKYLYNGKELQDDVLNGTGVEWYDYGARFYDPELGRFHTQDRFSEKYLNMTPYQYAANNPIRYIDVNGDSIRANQAEAQQMITNTLTKEDAEYVQFDENGNINLELLNSHSSESGNYYSLLGLANAETVINVSLDDHFDYVDENGVAGTSEMSYQPAGTMEPDVNGETMNGTTTGEAGLLGKTLFPDLKGKQNSPDGTIRVVVNKNLSEAARAEIYSHEANGHAYIYVTTGGDRERASHNVTTGWKEQNKELSKRIIDSKKETVINMRNR